MPKPGSTCLAAPPTSTQSEFARSLRNGRLPARIISRLPGPPLLKRLYCRWDLFFLLIIYLLMLNLIYAFKLFPTHDCYNNFLQVNHFIISNLLSGDIPFWDPLPACGWPLYLAWSVLGVFEPFFVISIIVGRLLSLDVLQVYLLWLALRTIPLLIGCFWLMRQLSGHSFCSLLMTAFLYLTLAMCFYRDHVFYVIYLPLMLAALIHYYHSIQQDRPSLPSLFLAVVCFSISIQIYIPVYCLIFLLAVSVAGIICFPRNIIKNIYRIFKKKTIHLFLSAPLLVLLLLPIIVSYWHLQRYEYFPYCRVLQEFGKDKPLLSNILDQKIIINQIGESHSTDPVREMMEIFTCLTPVYHSSFPRMEGILYFGIAGLMGVTAGLLWGRRRRKAPFFSFLLASLVIFFIMSPSASSWLSFFETALPFLSFLRQRHLLYPVFLICVSVAGCLGLVLIVDQRYIKITGYRYRSLQLIIAFGVIVALSLIIIKLFGSDSQKAAIKILLAPKYRIYLFLFFTPVLVAIFMKLISKNRKYYIPYILFMTLIVAVDFGYHFVQLTKTYNRNEGVFPVFQSLRDRWDSKFKIRRSPLLPTPYGTVVQSVTHIMGLPTALPAYWHSDIVFTSSRYYEILSQLSAPQLKTVLAIDAPIVRFYRQKLDVSHARDGILTMMAMEKKELANILILESPQLSSNLPNKPVDRTKWLTACGKGDYVRPPFASGGKEGVSALSLFDGCLNIPDQPLQKVGFGYFHCPVYLLPLAEQLPVRADGQIDAARSFFPEYPSCAVISGNKIIYFSTSDDTTESAGRLKGLPRPDEYSPMEPLPGRGFLLEPGGGGAVRKPKHLYFLNEGPPVPKEITVSSFGSSEVCINTDVEKEGWLFWGTLFDPNWQAFIDGRPAAIQVADHAFMAVPTPAGKHKISFIYRPPGMLVAIYCYFSTLVIMLIGGIVVIIRKFLGRPLLRAH
jgi:hypothetical protein